MTQKEVTKSLLNDRTCSTCCMQQRGNMCLKIRGGRGFRWYKRSKERICETYTAKPVERKKYYKRKSVRLVHATV